MPERMDSCTCLRSGFDPHLSAQDGIAPGGVRSSVGQLGALQQRKVAAEWYSSCGHCPYWHSSAWPLKLRQPAPESAACSYGLCNSPTRCGGC